MDPHVGRTRVGSGAHGLRHVLGVLGVLVALVALLPVAPAAAATLVVTETADVDDGACTPDHCSLREAVAAANAAVGPDVISLPAGATITLSAPAGGLDVVGELVVQGDGATIAAAYPARTGDTRLLDIGGTDPQVELREVRLTGGDVDGLGGAVRVAGGRLALTDVMVEGNGALGDGGGIWLGGAVLAVTGSTFAFNAAAGDGGAIACEGCTRIDIDTSTFSANHAHDGGAVHSQMGDTGDLFIHRSTFVQNWADRGSADGSGYGGAVNAQGGAAIITQTILTGNGADLSGVVRTTHGGAVHLATRRDSGFTSTTLADNRAIRQGGGLLVSRGFVILSFSTVSGNATTDPTGTGGGVLSLATVWSTNSTYSGNRSATGGGAAQAGLPPSLATATGEVSLWYATVFDNGPVGLGAAGGSSLALQASIVGGSADANCFGAGTITSGGWNLEDADDCGLRSPGDQITTDPLLGPLADNGGRLPQGAAGVAVGLTRALRPGSPAIDGVEPAHCVEFDQRGTTRPQGPACDIGAYEREAGDIFLFVEKSVSPTAIALGGTAVFTVTMHNFGTASTHATSVDTVASSLAIGEMTASAGTATVSGQQVTWEVPDLAGGTSETLAITVTAIAAGTVRNVVVITDPEVTGGGGTATSPDLVVGGDPLLFPPDGTSRIEGATRIETAIDGSQAVFGDGEASAVVLTRADLFPDAQAGTPLAIAVDAPMLLTEPAALNPLTEAEILRVLPAGGPVYLLGGTAALSDAVRARLDALGFDTMRYGGANRFGTAAIIAAAGLADPATLLCADGGDFPDSVVAGAASVGAGDAAVILSSGSDLPPETATYLDGRTDDPELIAIGGDAAAACDDAGEALVGATRFETAITVAERFFAAPRVVGIATGLDFPDALTGGAIIGRPDVGPGPMLLTTRDAVPATLAAYLTANAATIDAAVIFGGPTAVSTDVEDAISALLGF